MAWTKEDRAFKILINKRVTTSDKKYYEEFGDNTLDISFSEIKTQKTPYNDPAQGIINGVVKAYNKFVLTEDITVPNRMCYYAIDSSDSTRTLTDDRLRYWISSKDGGSYAIKLYDYNENEITPTACNWFFDYVTGILTFDGAMPDYPKPYKIKGYRYVGAMGGKIGGGFGQKDLYDEDFFPDHTEAADNHVPVYVAENDRYELKPLPNFISSNIEVITKRFNSTTQSTYDFTVDTSLTRIIYVSVNGIVQTEGEDYSLSGRTVSFIEPVGTGKHVVIEYFKNLNATIVVEGETNIIQGDSYKRFEINSDNRTLDLVPDDLSKTLSSNIMEIFNLKIDNSWNQNRIYKFGDYSILKNSLYVRISHDENGFFSPLDVDYGKTYWQKLIAGKDEIEVTMPSSSISGYYLNLADDAGLVTVFFEDNENDNGGDVGGGVALFANLRTLNNNNNDPVYEIVSVTGLSNGNSVRIYPAKHTQIRIREGYNMHTDGGLGVTLNGNTRDWVEFINRNGHYYMMNAGSYTYDVTNIVISG